MREPTAAETRHLEKLFRAVRHTLLNRGLFQNLQDGGVREVVWRRTLFIPDLGLVAFEVDVQRLPVRIEQLLDLGVAHQIEAALGGRRVKVTNSRGLVFGVRLEPNLPEPKVRLPHSAPLDLDSRPEGAYLIPVGFGEAGPVWRSLLQTGHVLVGGESGSGKSTWLNTMLVALLSTHTPEELRVAIVDPKEVEFIAYRGAPHLFCDVAVEVGQAAALLARTVAELDRRRALFSRAGAKSLARYNRLVTAAGPLPLILLIVDEVTDIALEAGLRSPFYTDLTRLASKGRAFGLVLVLATQNPKAEVLNTLIRGNMSTRIAFRVSTVEHSKTILGVSGAQGLPRTIRGRLLARMDDGLVTLQGFYLPEEQLEALRADFSKPITLLTEAQKGAVRWAIEQNSGYLGIDEIADRLKLTPWKARRLAEAWERRGWLEKDQGAGNKRLVTDSLLEAIEQGTVVA